MPPHGREGPAHSQGKWRVYKHLQEIGIECVIEDFAHHNFMLSCQNWDGRIKTYFPDISCKNGFIIEIDGKKGHSSKSDSNKDHRRDKLILEKYGIFTIRLKLNDILKKEYNMEIKRYGISNSLIDWLVKTIKDELKFSDNNGKLKRDKEKYTKSPMKLLFKYED